MKWVLGIAVILVAFINMSLLAGPPYPDDFWDI